MCPIRQAADTSPALQINLQKGSEFPEFAREVQSLNDLDLSIRQRIAEKLLPSEPVSCILIAPRQRHIDADKLRWAWLTRWLFWQSTPDWVVVLTPLRVLVSSGAAREAAHSLRPPALLISSRWNGARSCYTHGSNGAGPRPVACSACGSTSIRSVTATSRTCWQRCAAC